MTTLFAILLSAGFGAGAGPGIQILPAEPRQGGFVQFALDTAGPDIARIEAWLGEEALHFEPGTDHVWRALGGIPIDAAEELPLTIIATWMDGTIHESYRQIRVRRVAFATEQLRVAPRFSAPPDSVLAARIEEERARAAAVSRLSHRTPRLWHGPFLRPRPSRVTSPFGKGREFNGELQSRHLGVDLAGARGAPVRAPNAGIVALIDSTYYGGTVIYLDHGAGLVTAYLHLSATLVAVGDTVARGTLIGRVGATGRVTGPHLHWIARYGDVTLDALSLESLALDEFEEGNLD